MNQLKIVKDPEDAARILLFWGDLPWKKLYKSLFFNRLRCLFSASSLEEAEKSFQELEEKVAKSFAVKTLGRKALFSKELMQKMQEKGFSAQAIESALVFSQKIGALQDRELFEQKVRREFQKGKGLFYVKAKWSRSIEQEEKWSIPEQEVWEREAALRLVAKQKHRKDLFLFLLRRGFRREIIEEVLNSEQE